MVYSIYFKLYEYKHTAKVHVPEVKRPVVTCRPIQAPKPAVPWRKLPNKSFETFYEDLKKELETHRDTLLNIMLVGHSGAGKSSLINSVFSISRGRIVDKATVKSDKLPGVGTLHFTDLKTRASDMFQGVRFFDTMGYAEISMDDTGLGITENDLKAIFDGRVKPGHKFNEDTLLGERVEENIPHCIVFVVAAEELEELTGDDKVHGKIRNLHKLVPTCIAKIAVITKIDRVCSETHEKIDYIYTSKKVHGLVKKAEAVLGVQENHVFPIVNFVTDVMIDKAKGVPIMFALKFGLDFAEDRKEEMA